MDKKDRDEFYEGKGWVGKIQNASEGAFDYLTNKFKSAIGMNVPPNRGRGEDVGIGSAIEKPKTSMSRGGGNPLHYGTHMKERKGMNRQGRSSGKSTCHHGK